MSSGLQKLAMISRGKSVTGSVLSIGGHTSRIAAIWLPMLQGEQHHSYSKQDGLGRQTGRQQAGCGHVDDFLMSAISGEAHKAHSLPCQTI